ncbi:ARM repeat-containing protein [Armillaria gallica]|uniref:ARM repeat-containing protein n=1 Tax=Armillaria gallica TaxID=47427 RepID=A0A2H3E1T5_ARMGA|nr:ARM repeat-containing protein [Armillaria gallica]
MASTTQISECLAATLSSNANERISAELKLIEYFSQPGTSLALSELIVSSNVDMPLRQSASIVLRKYVRERWSPFFQGFKGAAPPPEIKTQVRQAVFQGLSDPNRKIRSLCAHTLTSIANSDWPDEYPELLNDLISLLSSGSPDSVHGAMQVFTEFIKADLTEDQILPVLRDLLPSLLSILGATEQHLPLTRARTISVFRQCTISLFMVKDQYPQAVKEAIASVLPVWLEAFKVLLNMDPQLDANSSNWDGLAIRIQIFKTLETIHTSFPRALVPYFDDLLSASIAHLNLLYPTFDQYYLTSSEPIPPSSEDEPVHLSHLISSILDFMATVIRGGKAKQWFTSEHSTALIAAVFNYAQMTDEDEDTWGSNANTFVAQEDDETQDYSVRVAGFDLLGAIIDRATVQTIATFHTVIQQVIQSSDQARNGGKEDWWRPLEAGLAAIGSQAESIQDCLEDEEDSERPKPIDIENLLRDVIPLVLGLSDFPFLQGRGFVFASQYAKLLPIQLAGQYIDAAVQVIESNEGSIPVKISAVRAVHNFCNGTDDAALTPFMSRIAKDMGPFLLHTSEDTLSLVLETLSVIVGVDGGKWMTPELADSLVLAILEVWAKNNKDPILLSIFPDILESLASASAPAIYEVVVKQALPSLCNSISSASIDESWITSSAIDLVNSLINGSKNGLGDGFFALLAPHLFKCLGEADDRDVLQNGIICLTLIVRKDCKQLLSWSDNNGRSGLDYVLTLVAKVLQGEDESAGLTIGDLIIHLLRRAGDAVLPVLPDLLQAMVNRMVTAKTASFVQSLVIPFAFLITHQRDTVLSLLETTNTQGRSGLEVLIHTWCENAETFQGFWPSRISTMALSQLFVCERPSLLNLMVKGDLIVKPETKNVIMTRSRTRTTPTEFTSIAFPVKALKILIHDLQSSGESATFAASGGNLPDADDDEGDEDWSDQGDGGKRDADLQYLSDLIGPKGLAFDNDDIFEDNDDEDLKTDPISQMDMQEHLTSFLRECASRNTSNFSVLVEQLTAEEMAVVQVVVSQQ